jgi:hypothetical protein
MVERSDLSRQNSVKEVPIIELEQIIPAYTSILAVRNKKSETIELFIKA